MASNQLAVACWPQAHFEGLYEQAGFFHDKPMFKRTVPDDTVTLYFWRGDGNPSFTGWWLGPVAGGDLAYAFCHGNDDMPPERGWCQPADGPVDESMVVSIGGYLCSHVDENGMQCLDKRSLYHPLCMFSMCKRHCREQGAYCNRPGHNEEDSKPRAERANRRRGGKKARGSREPYEPR